MRTLVSVTYGLQMHPTDTEHKRPRGTDGKHVTSEAITAQLPTNLSLSYKSHVHSLTPVSHHFKGAGVSLPKGQSIKLSVHSTAFSMLSAVLCTELGGNQRKKFSVPVSLCPRTQMHSWEQTRKKKLHWGQQKMRAKRNPYLSFCLHALQILSNSL